MRLRTLLVPSLLTLPVLSCQSTQPGDAEQGTAQDGVNASAPVAQQDPGEVQPREALLEVSAASAVPSAQPASVSLRQDSILEDAAQRRALLEQRKRVLVDEYLRDATAQIEAENYAGALEAIANALDLLPGDQTALESLQRVEGLMGDDYATASSLLDDEVEREVVRRAQARIEAKRAIATGEQAMRDGDYDSAVLEFKRAELILGYNPLISSDDLDLQSVQRLVAAAEQERDNSRLEAAERRAVEAATAAAAKVEEERRYRENTLRTLYERANDAFLAERYGDAEALADQILLQDPANEAAGEMREIARTARHRKTDTELRRRYREEWIRTFEDLDTLAIPQTDVVVIDDLERWYRVSQRTAYEFGGVGSNADPEREAVLQVLRDTRVEARFGADDDGAELAVVAAYLQQRTGINFVVSPRVIDELDEEETTVTLDLPARSVYSLLELMTDTSEGLFWKIQDGVVKFVVAEEMTGGQVLNMFEVKDLVTPIQDYVSREINVLPSQGIEYPEEDLPERDALVLTGDDLTDLIQNNIAPESWANDDRNTIEVTDSGTLVVNQTPEVQAAIGSLLKDLRDSSGIMVDIEARFLEVEDNFLEDIGVDWRGLGQPGLGQDAFFNDFGDPSAISGLAGDDDIIGTDLDTGAFFDTGNGDVKSRIENLYDNGLGSDSFNGAGGLSFQWTYLNDLQFELILRAVSKSERQELVTAPRILIFNTARSHLSVLNQQAYVQDYDVEIATGASIADPIIAVVEEGVVLDVRPVVSADRRYITLELRPTVAELQRPIREITTGLANLTPVTIQLPELDIQKVRTTVPLPDGGTVLLGGLKVHTEQNYSAGVPILNKIPILSFFFERKGTFIANRKLLILLTAGIVIPREFEPSEATMNAFAGTR
ncbi:hypothetical protein [Engelhardtia mirabilis]|uniref:Type II secretion system protein D n=1 Tax=Engelhardtia mirabilis TaxID=2528011 RepID=A0A518BI62_9BACT|nr:Type II secretion system protein D precursor [Planctomycetes bacterium Pla133]QDV00994.1 Type II secretion system protein D precursor [Planctomycetes bacterium Pla86]